MRDYGKVHTSFWSSPTICGMSEDARLLAMYLITSPHSNIAGVFRLPDGYVCEDLNWGSERVSKGFSELLAKGYANRCGTTKWVWVCKHFEWNQPENPNQRKSAAKIALSIPDECDWKLEFMRVCGPILGVLAGPNPNPFETLSKPFLNQEQEQDKNTSRRKSIAVQPDGVPDTVWQDFKKLRSIKKAPITETAIAGIVREAGKAGMTLADALAVCCQRGWTGFQAAWLTTETARPQPRASPSGETPYQRRMREQAAAFAPGVARAAPSESPADSAQKPYTVEA